PPFNTRRRQEGGHRPIRLRNQPQDDAIAQHIPADQSSARDQRPLILLPVKLLKLAQSPELWRSSNSFGATPAVTSASSAPGVATILPNGKRSDIFVACSTQP